MVFYNGFLLLILLFPFINGSHIFNNITKTLWSKKSHSSNSTIKMLPLIVAHRGDSARMPENTIAAFTLALSQPVDFIEMDLVLTKDHIFVCHHDLTLGSATDIRSRPEFAHMKIVERNVTYDNVVETIRDDWLISDFTLKQLKSLQIVRWNQTWPMSIPTFDEFMETVKESTLKRVENHHPVVGIMPELKYPSYFNSLFNTSNFMERLFIEKLKTYDYDEESSSEYKFCHRPELTSIVIPCNPVIIQCWEQATIDFFHDTTSSLRLLRILWVNNAEHLTMSGMANLAGKVEYVGFPKEFLLMGAKVEIEKAKEIYDQDLIAKLGGFIPPEKMVEYIQQLGIKVAVYTITPAITKEELEFHFDIGVDAFFVEGLENTLTVRDEYFIKRNLS